jgi:hypothetical protein
MQKNYKAIVGLAGLLCVLGSRGNVDALIPEGPQVQTYAGIPYLSGGIGLDEREALRSLANEYNLQLSFALKRGNYLSDIEVLITDDRGATVLAAVSQGPWFLTRLPVGTYRIRAKTLGESLEQMVHVPQQGQARLSFLWQD